MNNVISDTQNPRFTAAFNSVRELVKTFKDNEKYYLSPEYQEAEVRLAFINKFFIALGWDVNHDYQKNPYEQEVKVEKGVAVGKAQKRADYAFYLNPNFRDPLFFVEAKKPFKNLKNQDDYFQTIRYGWNSGTPIAVLTDFEEFHILDCRLKPNINDIFNGSHKVYSLNEYLLEDTFAEIYYLFSQESVQNNSIQKYADALPKPKGKAVQMGLFKGGYQSIDESFLEYLSGVRETLAKAFKKNDNSLNGNELTEATQKTIDRLVFMRFLEDKLIEQDNNVSKFGERYDAWKDFIVESRRMDSKYNGVVFKPHFIDKSDFLGPDPDEFKNMCEDICHLNTPYDFNAIPIHILGAIYEQFLGKVVHCTDKRVKIEDKPEVRKAGGVYYTPRYIVDYIVNNTVGKLIEGKIPEQISKLKFADIACGSGSFLIGVFDCLIAYHQKYYQNNPEKAKKAGCHNAEGKQVLSIKQKQKILLNNIYGVDIDSQAVEVTQLSLCLKMLEDETTATANDIQVLFHEKILPDLSRNIICGNSIIGEDILDGDLFATDEEHKLNPMDYGTTFPEVMKNGGFDAVIGNPPYVRQETLGEQFKTYVKSHYKTFSGTADLYVYFFEKAHAILKQGGLFGMICSNKFMRANYGKSLRNFMSSEVKLIQIVDFGELPVFINAATFPAIFLTQNIKGSNQNYIYAPIKRLDFQSLGAEVAEIGNKLDNLSLSGNNWTLASSGEIRIFEKMRKAGIPLGEYVKGEIYYGIKTGLNEAFVIDYETRNRLISEDANSAGIIKPFVAGDDVRKYHINFRERYLILVPKGWTNTNRKADEPWKFFSKCYPVVAKHLLKYEEKAKKRYDKGEYWWELRECNYYQKFEAPKIIYPDIAKESRFTLDSDGVYGANTIYMIPIESLYILGILNSKLIFNYFKRTASVLGDADKGGRLRWFSQDIEKIPIAKPSDTDALSPLVSKILQARKQLQTAKTDKDKTYLERKCESLDKQIDSEVYKLYGLTEDEIRIIEDTGT